MVREFHEGLEFRELLRTHRRRRRLSQPELARRAALSVSVIKAYESGGRRPSPEALSTLIEVLGLPPEEATPLRVAAGFAADLEFLLYGKYESRSLETFAEELERYSWPVSLLNQTGEILAANRVFYAMLGPSLAAQLKADPGKRNLVAMSSNPEFGERAETWDEGMGFMIGLTKGDPRAEHNLERPAAVGEDVLRRFLSGDPKYIARLLGLWQRTAPIEHWTRHQYHFHWRAEDGRLMRFWNVMHVADVWKELFWSDFIPEDAETWTILNEQHNAR